MSEICIDLAVNDDFSDSLQEFEEHVSKITKSVIKLCGVMSDLTLGKDGAAVGAGILKVLQKEIDLRNSIISCIETQGAKSRSAFDALASQVSGAFRAIEESVASLNTKFSSFRKTTKESWDDQCAPIALVSTQIASLSSSVDDLNAKFGAIAQSSIATWRELKDLTTLISTQLASVNANVELLIANFGKIEDLSNSLWVKMDDSLILAIERFDKFRWKVIDLKATLVDIADKGAKSFNEVSDWVELLTPKVDTLGISIDSLGVKFGNVVQTSASLRKELDEMTTQAIIQFGAIDSSVKSLRASFVDVGSATNDMWPTMRSSLEVVIEQLKQLPKIVHGSGVSFESLGKKSSELWAATLSSVIALTEKINVLAERAKTLGVPLENVAQSSTAIWKKLDDLIAQITVRFTTLCKSAGASINDLNNQLRKIAATTEKFLTDIGALSDKAMIGFGKLTSSIATLGLNLAVFKKNAPNAFGPTNDDLKLARERVALMKEELKLQLEIGKALGGQAKGGARTKRGAAPSPAASDQFEAMGHVDAPKGVENAQIKTFESQAKQIIQEIERATQSLEGNLAAVLEKQAIKLSADFGGHIALAGGEIQKALYSSEKISDDKINPVGAIEMEKGQSGVWEMSKPSAMAKTEGLTGAAPTPNLIFDQLSQAFKPFYDVVRELETTEKNLGAQIVKAAGILGAQSAKKSPLEPKERKPAAAVAPKGAQGVAATEPKTLKELEALLTGERGARSGTKKTMTMAAPPMNEKLKEAILNGLQKELGGESSQKKETGLKAKSLWGDYKIGKDIDATWLREESAIRGVPAKDILSTMENEHAISKSFADAASWLNPFGGAMADVAENSGAFAMDRAASRHIDVAKAESSLRDAEMNLGVVKDDPLAHSKDVEMAQKAVDRAMAILEQQKNKLDGKNDGAVQKVAERAVSAVNKMLESKGRESLGAFYGIAEKAMAAVTKHVDQRGMGASDKKEAASAALSQFKTTKAEAPAKLDAAIGKVNEQAEGDRLAAMHEAFAKHMASIKASSALYEEREAKIRDAHAKLETDLSQAVKELPSGESTIDETVAAMIKNQAFARINAAWSDYDKKIESAIKEASANATYDASMASEIEQQMGAQIGAIIENFNKAVAAATTVDASGASTVDETLKKQLEDKMGADIAAVRKDVGGAMQRAIEAASAGMNVDESAKKLLEQKTSNRIEKINKQFEKAIVRGAKSATKASNKTVSEAQKVAQAMRKSAEKAEKIASGEARTAGDIVKGMGKTFFQRVVRSAKGLRQVVRSSSAYIANLKDMHHKRLKTTDRREGQGILRPFLSHRLGKLIPAIGSGLGFGGRIVNRLRGGGVSGGVGGGRGKGGGWFRSSQDFRQNGKGNSAIARNTRGASFRGSLGGGGMFGGAGGMMGALAAGGGLLMVQQAVGKLIQDSKVKEQQTSRNALLLGSREQSEQVNNIYSKIATGSVHGKEAVSTVGNKYLQTTKGGGESVEKMLELTDRIAVTTGAGFEEVGSAIMDAMQTGSTEALSAMTGMSQEILKASGVDAALRSRDPSEIINAVQKAAEAAGHTQEAYNQIADTVGGRIERMGASLQEALMRGAEKFLPIIERIAAFFEANVLPCIEDLLNFAVDIGDEISGWVESIFSFVAENKDLLLAILKVVAALKTVSIVMGVINVLTTAVSMKFIAIGLAVFAALKYIQYAVQKATGEALSLTQVVQGVVAVLFGGLKGLTKAVPEIISFLVDGFEFFVGFIGESIQEVFGGVASAIVGFFYEAFKFIFWPLKKIVGLVSGLIDKVLDTNFAQQIEDFGEMLNNTVDGATNWLESRSNRENNWGDFGASDRLKGIGDIISDSVQNELEKANIFGADGDTMGDEDNPMVVELSKGSLSKLDSMNKGTKKVKLEDEDIKLLEDYAERKYVAKVDVNTMQPEVNIIVNQTEGEKLDENVLGDKLAKVLNNLASYGGNISYDREAS